MPRTKKDVFKDNDNRLAVLSKALAHPARIAILRELIERSSCTCGEIVARVPLAQATVSQHLKELKEAGLIRGDVDGPKICYCLDIEGIKRLRKGLGGLFASLQTKAEQSCC